MESFSWVCYLSSQGSANSPAAFGGPKQGEGMTVGLAFRRTLITKVPHTGREAGSVTGSVTEEIVKQPKQTSIAGHGKRKTKFASAKDSLLSSFIYCFYFAKGTGREL